MLLHAMDICALGSVDRDKSAVYAAEDQWARLLDRGGTVNFFGSMLTMPQQQTFGDIGAVEDYVAKMCDRFRERGYTMDVPKVRARRGFAAAHYERESHTIALPINAPWSMREAVVIHEFSHHLAAADVAAHGEEFRQIMVFVADVMMGSESASVLTMAYRGMGLS
jgi:putative metallohydrolase (TIGR04338 family)